MLEIADSFEQIREGSLEPEEGRLLSGYFRWIEYKANTFSRMCYARLDKNRGEGVVAEFVGKLNNLIIVFNMLGYEWRNNHFFCVDTIHREDVCPLRRISGSLEETVPFFSAKLKEVPSYPIPLHLNHAHNFFDIFIFSGVLISGPQMEVKLEFEWDAQREEIVVENPDGHLARHVERILQNPDIHLDLSRQMIYSAFRMAHPGKTPKIQCGTDGSVIRVPMQTRK